MKKWLWLSCAVVVCDQVTKWWAVAALRPGEVIALVPGVNLAIAYNTGAAFGLLASAGGWQRWVLFTIALTICVFLCVWLFRLGRDAVSAAVSISLIIGGAGGNLIDRAWLGYVVDFIDVYYREYHWPTFNVADSAITIGVLLMFKTMVRT